VTLTITGLKESATNLGPGPDGTYSHIGSKGGTEMMAARILKELNADIRDQVQIIHSRVRAENLIPNKKKLLVLHDTWDDPESEHLSEKENRAKFAKLVFVSHYQQASFNMCRGVPYENGVVLQNAIDPIPLEDNDKKSSILRLVYHTTPHRGLELLVPVFEKLCEYHDNIHLDVYSSFEIYGWKQRDMQYQHLFDRIDKNPRMIYHGYQPNDVVRAALRKAHIYAYPNIWPETSCISVIEAMSAGVHVVCPNFAALPETCANFASMYGWQENNNKHANVFANVLNNVIINYWSETNQSKLKFQKVYFDNYYSWPLRAAQWNAFLRDLLITSPA